MKLLEPFRIGPVELKNRIIMAPMVTGALTKGWYLTGTSIIIPDGPRGDVV